jgi:hypothetical protein
MKLNVADRLNLLQVLPKEGNFATLKIVRDTQDILTLSEEDHKTFEIVEKGNTVTWNDAGKEEIEIPIGDKAKEIAKEALQKLDNDKKLTPNHVSIYEKFVQDKE